MSRKEVKSLAENTPLVELPAKAVEVIQAMDPEQRARGARMVVRLFLSKRHSLAPSLVGAIAKPFPELAALVVEEAVRMFPEHAPSIVRAAVGAAPRRAQSIAISAMIEVPQQTRQLLGHLRRQNPETAEWLVSLARDSQGERREQIAEAVYTTKNRIGTSGRLKPISMEDPTLNNPPETPQQVFIVEETGPGSEVLPENLIGSEMMEIFDVIMRQLLMEEANAFVEVPNFYVK